MRLAYFSPLSPIPSGIADYSDALLPHLAMRTDCLDVFIENYEPARLKACERLRIRPYGKFEADYEMGCYDAALYHLGNNPYHVYIYDLAMRVPGIIVLHEFNLHYLLAAATVSRQDWEGYFRELDYNAGVPALERARLAQSGLQELDYDNIDMNRRLLERSLGVIVHSEYVAELVRGAGFDLPIRRIPHGVAIPEGDAAPARKQLAQLTGLSLEESAPVFGIFGFLKPYKRVREALRAFARLRELHPAVEMVLVGEEHPHYPLRPLITELGIWDAVRILGYVPLETFITCMAGCDICVNLRRPTAGETSGSFLRELALGKPTLVSEIGAFLELPDDVAVKIPIDEREVDWLFEYMNVLLKDPELARAIGKRGQEYVVRECSWSKVASEYRDFLQECCEDAKTGNRDQGIGTREEEPALSSLSPSERAAQEEGAAFAAPAEPCGPRFSAQELEEYIVGFSHTSTVMEDYVQVHRNRLVHTVEITPPGSPKDRVLEMGCYLQMTPALRKYLRYGEVRGAYFGPLGRTDYRGATSVDGELFICPVDLFDAERDCFPYPDQYFHTVLCCELIEHLANDPVHMIAEINRILVPGGALVLSTPNIASLRSVHAILHGYHPGIFPAYIKPNLDGTIDPRHSREYTPREIAWLLEAGGFQVELLETGDFGRREPRSEWTEEFLKANQLSPDLRGEIIYCRGRKTGPLRERWPKELYYPP